MFIVGFVGFKALTGTPLYACLRACLFGDVWLDARLKRKLIAIAGVVFLVGFLLVLTLVW